MGAIGLGIIISLKDRASDLIDKIGKKVRGLEGVTQDMIKTFQTGSQKILAGAGLIGAGTLLLTKAFSAPLERAMQFEKGMSEVGTLVGGNRKIMDELGKSVMGLSGQFGKSTDEITKATYQAISAGVPAAQTAKFLEAAGKTAIAGVTDIATATDGLTSAVAAYGDSFANAGQYSDAMFVAMKMGKTTIGELSGVMGSVASSAANAGVSFDDLIGTLAAGTLTGKSTSETATGLAAAMKAIVAPSGTAQKAMESLGITVNEQTLRSRGLAGTFTDLVKATGGSQEKLTALLGSVEAVNAVLNVTAGNGANLNKILDEMRKKAGSTEEAFRIMQAAVSFRMDRLRSSFENLSLKVGNLVLPVFGWLIDRLRWFTDLLGMLPEPLLAVLVGVVGIAGAAAILVGVIWAVRGAMIVWRITSKLLADTLAGVKVKMMALMPKLLAFSLIAGLIYLAWKSNFGGLRDMVDAVVAGIKMAFAAGGDGIVEIDKATAAKLKKAGIFDFAVKVGQEAFRIRKFLEGVKSGFVSSCETIKRVFNRVMDILKPVNEDAKIFLKTIGLLDEDAKSNIDTWYEWGETIGKIAPLVLGIWAAYKTFETIKGIIMAVSAAQGLFNMALWTCPITWVVAVAIVAIIALIYWWGDLKAVASDCWDSLKRNVKEFVDFFVWAFKPVTSTLEWLDKKIFGKGKDGRLFDAGAAAGLDGMDYKAKLAEQLKVAGTPGLVPMTQIMDNATAKMYSDQLRVNAETSPTAIRQMFAAPGKGWLQDTEDKGESENPVNPQPPPKGYPYPTKLQPPKNEYQSKGLLTSKSVGYGSINEIAPWNQVATALSEENFNFEIKTSTAPIILDGRVVAQAVTRYNRNDNMRSGMQADR